MSAARLLQVLSAARRGRGLRAALVLLLGLALVLPAAAAPSALAVDAASPSPAPRSSAAAPSGGRAAQGGASQAHALLVVVDLSSSMSETDETGTVKLDGAKTALNQLIRAQPAGTAVGLWTYPSAAAGEDGCSPGEAAGPVGPLVPTTLAATVNALGTGGDTPTGTALRASVEALRAAGYGAGTVLLVSDGESNCGEPPCEVAADIVDEGFDVSVEAMGFRTSEQGRQELQCISSTTGGSYTDVEDSADLAARLAERSRPALDLRVDGVDRTVSAGTRVVLTATVTNTSALDAEDVRLSIVFLDAGPRTLFPGVVAPRQRLGRLPAGEAITRSWAFTAGVPGQGGTAQARIGAGGAGVEPVSTTATVRVSDAPLTLEDAGPLLKDAAARGRLAIVGDSFSAGEGAKDYFAGTDVSDNRCHRSSKTYAMALFKAVEEANMACSGAVSVDYYAPQDGRRGEDGQRFRLQGLDPRPDVVLLTFGGNDAGFADIIARCVLPEDCTQAKVEQPANLTVPCAVGDVTQRVDRTPGAMAFRALCGITGRPYPEVVLERIAGLERPLATLYRDISLEVNGPDDVDERGGIAPVIVLGYPQLFPLNTATGCANMTTAESRFGNRLAAALNATMTRAVAAAEARQDVEGVHFVPDVADAMVPDHTACSRAPHVNPFSAATVAGDPLGSRGKKQELLHPNPLGYTSMTASLVQWSQRVGTGSEPAGAQGDEPPAAPGGGGGGSSRTYTADDWDDGAPTGTIEIDAPFDSAPADVTLGRRVRVTASGFAPGATVRVTIWSTPRTLTSTTADDSGALDAVVPVPPDLPRGQHVLEADGTGPDGQPLRYVRAVEAASGLPREVLAAAVVSALALVVAAALLGREVLHRRRRTAGRSTGTDGTHAPGA